MTGHKTPYTKGGSVTVGHKSALKIFRFLALWLYIKSLNALRALVLWLSIKCQTLSENRCSDWTWNTLLRLAIRASPSCSTPRHLNSMRWGTMLGQKSPWRSSGSSLIFKNHPDVLRVPVWSSKITLTFFRFQSDPQKSPWRSSGSSLIFKNHPDVLQVPVWSSKITLTFFRFQSDLQKSPWRSSGSSLILKNHPDVLQVPVWSSKITLTFFRCQSDPQGRDIWTFQGRQHHSQTKKILLNISRSNGTMMLKARILDRPVWRQTTGLSFCVRSKDLNISETTCSVSIIMLIWNQ